MTSLRPRFEGANIGTWIGFKNFLHLVEEAVLAWLREQGAGARELYERHGLGVEIEDCSVVLPAVLHIDDEVSLDVQAASGRKLRVVASVIRDGAEVVVLRGNVTLALVAEREPTVPPPSALVAYQENALGSHQDGMPAEMLGSLTGNGIRWQWRAPYYYCHYSDRVQHSGFVRCLEEAVDRFLHERGISVPLMLAKRSWIPVVSRARVTMLAPVHMDEVIHTVFRVTDVLRSTMFDGVMDCYAQREGNLHRVATATILHGYAIASGPQAGSLAELDGDVARILLGGGDGA